MQLTSSLRCPAVQRHELSAALRLVAGSPLQQHALLPRHVQQQSLRNPTHLNVVVGPSLAPVGPSVVEAVEDKIVYDGRDYSPVTAPPAHVLSIWRTADAVCFDVDCTITINDGLDLLAEFMGVGQEVAELTDKAMDGEMDLATSLEERLKVLNCTPADIQRFLKAHPARSRLTPGIETLIKSLQERGIEVYLISGGFRELILPIAKVLGVPKDNVIANRMNWQWDDETGLPTRLAGFDPSEPTSQNKGKVAAIDSIRKKYPYETVVMIGDGITDLEAVQSTGGADLFIGYGGVIERPSVASQAEWYIYNWIDLVKLLKKRKVCMIGGGAWACAALHMVAQNIAESDEFSDFDHNISMYIHESEFEGRKLTEIINETKSNPKYLPGVWLGDNLQVTSNLVEAAQDADLLIFCAPHQFMHTLCKKLMGKIKRDAIAISLTKGMRVRPEGPQLISSMISKYLQIDCSVLMGANIAADIGREELSEAVIGYNNLESAKIWQKLFQRSYFNVNLLADAAGAEICGTLKNIVALAAGMVDGLGYGPNTKAAILREGLAEIRNFSKRLYRTVRDETFFDSCGVADLIATCYGGRNRLVAEQWTKLWKAGNPKTFDELEAELLRGQKLQGVLTSDEVQEILRMRKWEQDFPLFTAINRIVNNQLPPSWIVHYKEGAVLALDADDGEDDFMPVRSPSLKVLVSGAK